SFECSSPSALGRPKLLEFFTKKSADSFANRASPDVAPAWRAWHALKNAAVPADRWEEWLPTTLISRKGLIKNLEFIQAIGNQTRWPAPRRIAEFRHWIPDPLGPFDCPEAATKASSDDPD